MSQVRAEVGELMSSGMPTTFLDALRLTRRLKQPVSADLDALLQLHDHPSTTDGARDVLADFLRGRAQAMAHERSLGERVITLADSGKTVRAKVGVGLRVHLDTRAHRGGAWQMTNNASGVTWVASGMDTERRYTVGELRLTHAGTYSIALAEALSPPKRSHAKSQTPADEDRVFTLEIIIEP